MNADEFHPRNRDGQREAMQALTMLVHNDPSYDDHVGAFLLSSVRVAVQTSSIPYELCGAWAVLSCIAERALTELADMKGTTASAELQDLALELALGGLS